LLPHKLLHFILVKDNGIRFEGTHNERVFAPFQRLHSCSEYAGSGIGLVVYRKIVSRHHDAISAASQPGTFTITLSVTQQQKINH